MRSRWDYMGLWDEEHHRLVWKAPTNRPLVLRQIELAYYENPNLTPVWVTEYFIELHFLCRTIARILTGEFIKE